MRRLAAWLALALGALGAAAGAAAETLERVAAAVHVHSELSSGDFRLEELVALAERQGLGALLLAENYRARVEYGLPPFRALTRVSHEQRAVGEASAEYLERVRRARAASPRVLLVPGVEVIPHYRWTGSPLTLEMALHDVQKNLLVWGIEDADALARLPVIGNPRARVYAAQSALDALPTLLAIPGAWLLARRRPRRHRLGRVVVVVRRRAWGPGLVLCAFAIATVARGWPFTVDVYPPYEDYGVAPHQALIDHVDRAGGVTVWSFPEAQDVGERHVGPVRVTWATAPHPDVLLRTFRYTGFGALYEEATRVERPGGEWDRLLREHAAGERSRAVWGLAEAGFHGLSAGKAVGPVRTVFLVRERTEHGVLDALRRGRMYGVQRLPAWGLDLGELTVRAGTASGILGDTVRAAAGTPVEIRASIAASDGGRHDVRVTLVRNGAVAGAWTTSTPVSIAHHEIADGTPAVFRVEARADGAHRLLTNPVAVAP